jgi:diadenosine tetraphosphate (Ap4A) HIT family hydrolase
MNCPFCERIEAREVTEQNDLAAAFPDGYPLSDGHTLIVPLRHEGDFFKLTTQEQDAIMSLARVVQERLGRSGSVDGFNVGINVGEAAGQTVGHAHLHIIPRSAGDVEDPRGGVRWVIPDRAVYWKD